MNKLTCLLMMVAVAACAKQPAIGTSPKMTPCSNAEIGAYWMETKNDGRDTWFFMNRGKPLVGYFRGASVVSQEQVADLLNKAEKKDASLRQALEAVPGFAAPISTYADAAGNKVSILTYEIESLSINSKVAPDKRIPADLEAKLAKLTTIKLQSEGNAPDEFTCLMSYYPGAARNYLTIGSFKDKNVAYHMRRIAH